jgi:hypothetical protein
MEFIPEPKLKRMLMDKKELDFGDGIIRELKEEFRIYTKLIDIVGINRELKRFYIMELKSKRASYLALEQLLMYREMFEESLKHSNEYRDYSLQCYLIAGHCNQSQAVKYLNPHVKFVDYRKMIVEKARELWSHTADVLKTQGGALRYIFPMQESEDK